MSTDMECGEPSRKRKRIEIFLLAERHTDRDSEDLDLGNWMQVAEER